MGIRFGRPGAGRHLFAATAALALCAQSPPPSPSPAVDTDLSYEMLEQLQLDACARTGGPTCGFSQEDCAGFVSSTWPVIFDEQPDLALVGEMCTSRRTKGEFPGAYFVLQALYRDILAVLPGLGFQLNGVPAIGTLAGRDVNASLRSNRDDRVAIIVLNQALMNLAYSIPKIAAQTIVADAEGDRISIDLSEEGLIAHLQSHPDLLPGFATVLLASVGLAGGELPAPTPEQRPLILSLTQGAETFAVAHEVAHFLLEHAPVESRQLAQEECGAAAPNDVVETVNSWVNEVEADILAVKILNAVAARKAASREQNIYIRNTLQRGAAYYFLASEMHRSVRAHLEGASPPRATADELAAVDLVAACAAEPGCDFRRRLEAEAPDLVGLRRHPHQSVRRAIVARLASGSSADAEAADMLRIADAMERNTALLWALVEERLPRFYEAGIRLEPCAADKGEGA